MKTTVHIKEKDHLRKLIHKEMNQYGNGCNLNHIDVSKITDLSYMFKNSKFNGDISKWNVSNVINMTAMFSKSIFNNDIFNWDVSKVNNMSGIFANSIFNKNISRWNVSNVNYMDLAFFNSKFNQNLEQWKPLKAYIKDMFKNCPAPIPYWTQFDDSYQRARAKMSIEIEQNLQLKLENKLSNKSKVKI